ncbi:Putative protein-S-isoprenylcysteine methyltransferase [Legionella massiliensis]|uniref:Steroid 5-alpha reductase C-terminal domain-containing protein n=1 Tax=Legionella massiliensis TaxID=1034943 RepID=A0A078L3N1_9GAMM|nr:isoprenylcysteine carboxylmethyltransferase family protein [Legionella massiliensis]CDZ78729.1 Putative protein-S-isoprenylcysteine methyltransferase [Legionella massiliensis]CEE14467.1 Isoprenylcysteine carboxyl methyltransferase (ICMT) family protein [Legionella massiliensis]
MYTRMLVQSILWLLISALLLFVPAGTIKWWAAWVYILENSICGLCIGFWLAKHDPELLKERLSFIIQPEQKGWDKILMSVFLVLIIAWYPFMAHDVKVHGFFLVPLLLQILGALGIVISMLLTFFTFRQNTYAAPVVKIQKNRKHKVISSGLYGYVRHPMYSGALFYFFGAPLLLGSWLGLIFSLLLSILIAFRAYMEEQTLVKELEGYSQYMKKVPYRLIPYVW